MLNSGFSEIAVLMAAITALSVPAPFWSSTRRLMMFACGAIPLKVREYFGPVELETVACDQASDVRAVSILIDWRWSCRDTKL